MKQKVVILHFAEEKEIIVFFQTVSEILRISDYQFFKAMRGVGRRSGPNKLKFTARLWRKGWAEF